MRALAVPLLFFLCFAPVELEAKEAKFRVRILLATKQGNRIDPKISKSVRDYLAKSFGSRYTSFRQLDNRVLRVELNDTGEMVLPDQSSLKLRFREQRGDFVRLTMEIKDLRTTIRIRDGGLFFQAGHRYKNGMLILAITAHLGKKTPEKAEKITTPRPEPRTIVPTPDSNPKRLIEK
jgi:hypothetical protein